MKVGLVGTGMLGEAVGNHLLDLGYSLMVYNRTEEKTKSLVLNGAKLCTSPRSVAKDSDLVLTCVTDANAVRHVSFGKNGLVEGFHDGLAVADMSTIDPDSSKEISRRFNEYGIPMLDTPVMGGPNVAVTGHLIMMVGGDYAIYKRYSSVFDDIASTVFYIGKNGTAHTLKLAMNLQIAMLALALSEGISLVEKAGIDPQLFLKVLNSTYFKTGMSQKKAFKMIKGEFVPTFTLKNLNKDLRTVNKTARSLGLRLPMSLLSEDLFSKATDNGFGELDYTGILAYLNSITSKNLQN